MRCTLADGNPVFESAVERYLILSFTAMQPQIDLLYELQAVNRQIHVINGDMQDFKRTFLASMYNFRVLRRNSRVQSPHLLDPLQKTIPGHGLVLARAVSDQDLVQHDLVAPAQPAAIGTLPPSFNTDTNAYENADILALIIFYNEDFGITNNDPIDIRIQKLRNFLTL
ncbi:hypothetical protein D9615_006648 [Tricholomella constricta]|uniref:Uncharacterized protein n=1 Tax=Tricholomella constricta TaxID=117010 RepID=A0A8H5M3J4_9AGAR|nr:hypothetical protein D9615_006648 [Tricholomella constricta]